METNCKNCNNCAWFCHSDCKCYVPFLLVPETRFIGETCDSWTYDGLEDWEREDCETLVTMEKTTA